MSSPVVRAKPKIPGLSLRDPSDPMISQLAASSQSILGDELDAYLLGNVSVLLAGCPQAGRIILLTCYRWSNRNPIFTVAMVKDRTSQTIQSIITSVCVPREPTPCSPCD